MCGIAGQYAYAGAINPELIDRLSKFLYKRGPDAHGSWESPDHLVRFAHRRLSILDLSSLANQPMIERESGCALVFNGEIYNFEALRKELITLGFTFRSRSDTEVILKGYLYWGEDVVRKLRGMFAFALYDPAKRALWLARDPYGIKPLYYADRKGCFTFASQAKPLHRILKQFSSVEPAALVGFMLLGSVPEPYTLWSGIRALPAGHSLWVTEKGVGQLKAYASVSDIWRRASQKPEHLASAEFKARVQAALRESVTAHQVADVPVGAFLSAGIDSGALVGLMAENRSTPVQTITLGFSRFRATGLDEVKYAEQISARYSTRQKTVWVSDADAIKDLSSALDDMDQPSIDGFNTWLVSKHAAALGLKVVVSGVGGDELFGGYSHFAQLPAWSTRLRHLAKVPGLLPLAAIGIGAASRFGLVHAKAADLCRVGPDFAGLYLVRRGLFMPWELPSLLDADLVSEGLAALRPPSFLTADMGQDFHSDYAMIAALEANNYLRNQLLRDSDWASMAHSLELRTPLVDFQLLKDLAPVLVGPRPPGLEGKRALALTPRLPLPNAVIDRPKSGFSLPMNDWLEQTPVLDAWRGVPQLTKSGCHWSRRMAYALAAKWAS